MTFCENLRRLRLLACAHLSIYSCSCWGPRVHRMEVLVRRRDLLDATSFPADQCPSVRLGPLPFPRIIEMQAFLAELVENFQFDPPAERVEIQRALAAMVFGMFPVVKGEADRGGAMPIRISFAQ